MAILQQLLRSSAPCVQKELQTVISVHFESRLSAEFFQNSNCTHKIDRTMYYGDRPQHYRGTTTSRFIGMCCEFEAQFLHPFWGFCVEGRD